MPDSIGWNFEESSSLGIVNNDNAAVARFNGSIKTFLREAIQNSADALWPRVEDNLPSVEINIKIRKLTGRKKTEFLKSLEWDDLKEHLDAVADHVVTLKTNSKISDFKIVFESKSANTYNSSSAITKELTKAMENRGADFGIFVFDNYERFDKVSGQPFALLSENMALTVLNEEVGDLPLKIAYIWAKNLLMNSDESRNSSIIVIYYS